MNRYLSFTNLAVAILATAALPATAQSLVFADTLPNAPSYSLQGEPQTSAAQAPGSISGTVSDIRGGLVPGASIRLERVTSTLPNQPHTHTDADPQVVSGSDGRFSFASVAPGSYAVHISAPGLESFLSQTVILRPGERFELPDIALPIATNNTSIDVDANTSQVAEQELHLEVQQRVLGVFPNFYTSFIYNAAPLDTKQKFKLSFYSAFDPIAFLGAGVVAGIEQANNTFPGYGDDATGFAKRYGAAYGDQAIGRILGSAVFPSVFRQDPRYFYMGPANPTKTRIFHALQSGVIVRGDNGHLQPNYSHILGNASAGALSSLYHPDANGPGELALDNALIGIAGTAVQALVREFLFNHVTHKVPDYAKGKPAPLPEAPAAPPTVPTPASKTTALPSTP